MPTNPTPITALPTAPSRADPANFPTRADAFLGALGTFGTQTNALGAATYTNAVEAAQAATDAAASFSAALTAGTGITGTSTSTLTIGTGSKSLTIETGRAFVAGMPLRIGQAGANANVNYMDGTVTSYDASTGALVANVTAVGGSGTLSAWAVRALGLDLTKQANTFTATQTFSGSTSVAAAKLTNAKEVATVSATAATGTIAYDVTTQSVLYYTSNASANWTVNFRGSSGTSLNTLMNTGESITVAFLVTQGATAYYNSAVQVDGSAVTPKYQGGTAWTAGNASSIDAYTYTIVKTGSAAFTVFAAQTQFK